MMADSFLNPDTHTVNVQDLPVMRTPQPPMVGILHYCFYPRSIPGATLLAEVPQATANQH